MILCNYYYDFCSIIKIKEGMKAMSFIISAILLYGIGCLLENF